MSSFFSSLYKFFASKETPNSAFYVTVFSMVGTMGTALAQSGNPQLMAIGGMIGAFYAIGHSIAEGISATKKTTVVVPALPDTGVRLAPPSLGTTADVPAGDVATHTEAAVPSVSPFQPKDD